MELNDYAVAHLRSVVDLPDLSGTRYELREEIGTNEAEFLAESQGWLKYDLPFELSRGVWGGRYRGQQQKWFAMRFTGNDSDIDLATEHPEFDAWKWISPERLPDVIVPFKRQLYIDILGEFREHCAAARSR